MPALAWMFRDVDPLCKKPGPVAGGGILRPHTAPDCSWQYRFK
jgi:hypothetical protein